MSENLETATPEATPAPATETTSAPKDSNGYDVPPSAMDGKPDSMFDSLSAAYDKFFEGETEESKDDETAPNKDALPDVKADEDSDAESDAKPDQAETKEQAEPDDQGHDQPAIDAPTSWSADVKAKWNALPPDVQEYVAQREKETHAKISEQGAELSKFKPVTDLYKELGFQGDLASDVSSLLKAQANLNADPEGALKWIAQSIGVDINKLADKPAEPQREADPLDDLFHDPRVDNLTRQNEQLMAKIEQLEQGVNGWQQRQEYEQRLQAERQVQDALEDARESMPMFRDMENDIGLEVQFLRHHQPDLTPPELLKKAYDRALALSPEIRTKLDAEKKAKEKAEAEKKIAKAKAAASNNVKTNTTPSARKDKGGFLERDSLSDAYDAIMNR